MNATISGVPEVYSLSSFSSHNQPSRPYAEIVSTSRFEHEVPTEPLPEAAATDANAPDNAATDQRPTRNYQIMLLLSGLFMTFHIIGITSVYGIFQVSCTTAQ